MLRKSASALFLSSVFCSPANAFAVHQLDAECRAAESSIAGIACIAFVHGLIDGMVMMATVDKSTLYCAPKGGLGVDQAKGVILQYFAENPDVRDEEAGAIAAIAIGKAFPCAGEVKPQR